MYFQRSIIFILFLTLFATSNGSYGSRRRRIYYQNQHISSIQKKHPYIDIYNTDYYYKGKKSIHKNTPLCPFIQPLFPQNNYRILNPYEESAFIDAYKKYTYTKKNYPITHIDNPLLIVNKDDVWQFYQEFCIPKKDDNRIIDFIIFIQQIILFIYIVPVSIPIILTMILRL